MKWKLWYVTGSNPQCFSFQNFLQLSLWQTEVAEPAERISETSNEDRLFILSYLYRREQENKWSISWRYHEGKEGLSLSG